MKVGVDLDLGMETETLELKETMHSICAILNKHQYGELYFGVKSDGTVVGQVVTEKISKYGLWDYGFTEKWTGGTKDMTLSEKDG